ncbi:hypothetical protein R1sor_011870 [Riccia sorocarpa]|uniref:Switch 2 n=1 Tax=Riccia sorocarpa TaxID=122646 RepID=A0ABD3I414_9MARC
MSSYKAFKELFQNCASVEASALSQQVRALGIDEAEDRKPLKTSLKYRIAELDEKERGLKPKPASSFKPSISLPALRLSEEISEAPYEGEKNRSALQPCSRAAKTQNQQLTETDLDNFGPPKRKHRWHQTAPDFLDSLERSDLVVPRSNNSVSSAQRRVKPRRAVTLPVSAAENKIVEVKEEAEGDIQETQSLIHALEYEDFSELGQEKEVGASDEHVAADVAFEALVLWPPPGEGSSSAEAERVEVPGSINSRLLEHQREGVRFLYKLYRHNHGGILGDDMGLGKTIQSIALLAAVLGKRDTDLMSAVTPSRQKGPYEKVVLIICPTSVLQNWDQEIEAWGDFRVGTYFGAQREAVLGRINAKEVEIVLTSHDTFRIHGEELCKIKWDCVIVDEAHRLKNDKSHLYIMCMKLPTRRRYGLTGTVMQNTYMELFNVFEWATPGCLGTREHFRDYYSVPIKEGQRISAPRRFQIIAEDRQKHLLTVLRKYFLRRTKQQTIAHLLNGKEDNVIFCSMTPLQKRAYRRILQSPDFQALIGKALPCTCGSPLKRGQCCYRIVPNGVIWPYLHKDSPEDGCDYCPNCLVLPCLTKLQQVSNHLELIKPNSKDDESKQAHDYNFAAMALGEDADLVGGVHQETSFLGLSDAQHCGKMLALEKLLSEWISEGDKVLLFSYSVKMLDILDKFLIRKGYSFCRLDGSTPMSSRQSLVEDFNTSPSKQIFLISTRAGGLGLNLVSANRVLIFDPNWNPSHDLQAQDRSFRYGQVRHVTVYRLLAAGSLEELVYTRQVYKQQLFNIGVEGANEKRYFEGVQGSKEHKGELFGIENLLRDLSDEVFAETIIEDHDARLLRIEQGRDGQADEKESTAHVEIFGLEEVEGSQGGVTSLDTVEPDCQLGYGRVADTSWPVAGDGYAEDKAGGVNDKERNVLRRVQSALTSAGVLYAHRNEDVVNMGGHPRQGVSSRSESAADSTLEPKVVAERPLQPSKERKQKAETSRKVIKPSEEKVKVVASISSSSSTMEPASGKSSKEVFSELARFKGLDISEFSKWLISATKEERAQLRLDYQESQRKSTR